MTRILLIFLLGLSLLIPTSLLQAAEPLFLNSVRPLQMLDLELDRVNGDEHEQIHGALAFRNICTVTSINQQEKYWLTAAHCVADESMMAADPAGRFIENTPVIIKAVDYARDLVVLYAPFLDVKSVKFQRRPAEWGQELIIAGHPFGEPSLFVTRGYVSNPYATLDGQSFMIFDVAGAPGNSGSPVFNTKSEVVSVLQIGWGRSFSPLTGGATWSSMVIFAMKYFAR